ncbi:MAG: hypothetical protein ACRENS_00285 [Candidatus Eiseniibacteriota bacterium]
MFTLLALAVVAFVVLAVLGLAASLVAMIWWAVLLPFRLLGFVFKLIAGVLALPFLILFALVGALIFASGLLIFFVPFLPFALLVVGLWWLMKPRSGALGSRAH